MATGIKGDARNQDHVDAGIVGERFADWFHDAKGPCLKVVSPCIATEFHAGSIQDLWQKNSLTFGYEIIDKLMGAHLIGQGVIGHDDRGFCQMGAQTLQDRKRHFCQLYWRELPLPLADQLSEFGLTHGQPMSLA